MPLWARVSPLLTIADSNTLHWFRYIPNFILSSIFSFSILIQSVNIWCRFQAGMARSQGSWSSHLLSWAPPPTQQAEAEKVEDCSNGCIAHLLNATASAIVRSLWTLLGSLMMLLLEVMKVKSLTLARMCLNVVQLHLIELANCRWVV